jgi:hypothetical protein
MEQIGKNGFEGGARRPDDAARGRDSLLLVAQLRPLGGTRTLQVRIRNLSAGGLMAELPQPLVPDSAVEIEVRGIGWIAGRVAWQTEGRAGIAFDRAIDPQLARKPIGVAAPDDAAEPDAL